MRNRCRDSVPLATDPGSDSKFLTTWCQDLGAYELIPDLLSRAESTQSWGWSFKWHQQQRNSQTSHGLPSYSRHTVCPGLDVGREGGGIQWGGILSRIRPWFSIAPLRQGSGKPVPTKLLRSIIRPAGERQGGVIISCFSGVAQVSFDNGNTHGPALLLP